MIRRLAVTAAVALLLTGCAATLKPLPPTPTPTPSPTPGPAIQQTRAQLEASLRLAGFGLIQPTGAFRPAEPPDLTTAPRGVYQVVLPDDPAHGYVVIYSFPDLAAASAAGVQLAAYLASGPTRVQFPPDTRFVLRQVGTTLVLYDWSPANSVGSGAETAANVIASLGQGIPVGP